MINLDDEQYDQKIAKIFNNGEAGRSSCIMQAVVPKNAEDKPNSPDYKVVFTDSTGGTVNISFWSLNDPNHEHYAANLKRDGKKLKHLVHTLCGPTQPIPRAETAPELLQAVMSLISQKQGTAVNVMTTYGTNQRPSQYLNIRTFPPFIELAATPEDTSLLTFIGFELQSKPEASDGGNSGGGTTATTETVDWAE